MSVQFPVTLQPIITYPVNSGQGDSIRTAFNKCNENFRAIEDTLVPAILANLTIEFDGGPVTSQTIFESEVASTSTTTGSVIVYGGMGIDGNVHAGGDIIGSTIIGDNLEGTITTAVQPNITTIGTLDNLAVTGNVAAFSLTANNITIEDGISSDSLSVENLDVNTSATINGLTATGTSEFAGAEFSQFVDFLGNVRMQGSYFNVTSTTTLDIYGNINLSPNVSVISGKLRPVRLNLPSSIVIISNTDPVTTGTLGEVQFDDDYLYICISQSPSVIWKRVPLQSF